MTRALAVLILVLVAATIVGSGPGVASSTATACPAPLRLQFVRKTGATAGLLRWRAPRTKVSTAGYRVFRNGVVVGQTRKLQLRVRVTPGRRVTLSVRVALHSGRTLPCRAAIVRRVTWKPPTTPRNVTVEEQESGIRIAWTRSLRGEGRLVGYRVFRDGAALRQVKGLSLIVALPPLRTATFWVRAVDSRGKLSPRSLQARVVRGHTAPTVPPRVLASAVSDREVALSWDPSSGSGGVRLSYQVRRNGQLVTQISGTELRVGNLFPSTTYSFAITAVDSLGYRSAETPPVEVTTQAPPQTSGGTFAFVLASTSRSFHALQAHYQQIGTVVPTYFDCRSDGAFEGKDDPLISRWAKARGIRVHARWNCQRTATLNRILRDPGTRESALAGIVDTVVANGYDGANIDFEAGAAVDRDAFSSFINDLAARIHAAGKTLSVDVSAKFKDVKNHPRSTFYDYDALSNSADTILVMAWGIHWSTSKPGAIDDLSWVTQVADYVAARPRREKFVLGFGLYGFDWPNGGGTAHPGTPLEYEDIMTLAGKVGAAPATDLAAQSPMFRYTEDNGVQHEVWYVDAASLGLRLEVARSRGLRIGLWRLGREDQKIWSLPALAP